MGFSEIKPTGWLKNQLRIQADGLSGHLHEFWPDIADSQLSKLSFDSPWYNIVVAGKSRQAAF
ncbi:MAG: hypothetical protein SCM11_01240 [Bacillota bacterium]|nr:hypothetical protein [Bacillota bacterium]